MCALTTSPVQNKALVLRKCPFKSKLIMLFNNLGMGRQQTRQIVGNNKVTTLTVSLTIEDSVHAFSFHLTGRCRGPELPAGSTWVESTLPFIRRQLLTYGRQPRKGIATTELVKWIQIAATTQNPASTTSIHYGSAS